MKIPKFLTGLLIGTAVGLIIWYWQKSTSAEEGALAVLDRLAAAEARVRELEGKLRLNEAVNLDTEPPEVLSGLSGLWGLDAASAEGVNQEKAAVDNDTGDNLKVINGIGHAYERRLKQAGINTYADLAQQSPEELRTISGLRSQQAEKAEKWVLEAKNLAEVE